MFKKFFGKKNDGFYMQIEDDAPAKVEAKAKPSPVVTPAPAVVATTPIVADAAAVTAAPVAAAAVAPTAVGEKPQASTPEEKKIADAEKVVAKAAAKAEKKATKKAIDEKKVAPVVAAAPVAPAPALPPITNFATDYLIKPSSDSTRRRPGANMSKFIELAREAKIPVNIKK